MALSKIDTAKFISSLVERITKENPDASQYSLYTKTASAIMPLIANGDIESDDWVVFSNYFFPNTVGMKTPSIEKLTKELDELRKEHSEALKKTKRLEKQLKISEEKKETPKPSYSSYSSDPCASSYRTSTRSGGC